MRRQYSRKQNMVPRTMLGLLTVFLALPCPAQACSICNSQGATLRQESAQAKMVLYGTVTKSPATADGLSGITDFTIEKVIKNDPFLGDKKAITLPRLVAIDPKNPPKFVIFCDVFKDKIDPYRGMPVKTLDVVEYLQGALALDKS